MVLGYVEVGAVGELEVSRGEDVVGRAFRDDAAVHADDPGQVRGHCVDFVSGHDDGHVLVVEFVEEVHDFVAGLDVDAHGGFVEEEQLWAADERSGEESALLLSAGQVTDVSFGKAIDAESLHDFFGIFLVRAPVPGECPVFGGSPHHDDLLDGDWEVPIYGFELGDVAHDGFALCDGSSVDANFAVEQAGCAKDGSEQRGLSGAAGSEDADEAAVVDGEVDVLEDWLAIVAACYVYHLDDELFSVVLVRSGMKHYSG